MLRKIDFYTTPLIYLEHEETCPRSQSLIKTMKKILKSDTAQKIEKSISPNDNTTTPYFANLEKNFKGRPSLQIEMFDIFLNQLPLACLLYTSDAADE